MSEVETVAAKSINFSMQNVTITRSEGRLSLNMEVSGDEIPNDRLAEVFRLALAMIEGMRP